MKTARDCREAFEKSKALAGLAKQLDAVLERDQWQGKELLSVRDSALKRSEALRHAARERIRSVLQALPCG